MSLIENLYRYPIKGFSAEPMNSVDLSEGQGVPLDRKFAITNGTWDFLPEGYQPRPKTDFLVLVKYEQLAEYGTHYDEATNAFSMKAPDGHVLQFNFASQQDRDALSSLLAERLSLSETPQLVEVEGIRFTDVSVVSTSMMNAISLINLASVEALQAEIGEPVDPLRFRANIYFRTDTPWEELAWVGRDVRVGGAVGKVVLKTRRCAATNVDPVTAKRNLSIPQTLMKKYRHMDLGIYVEVTQSGHVDVGDTVTLI